MLGKIVKLTAVLPLMLGLCQCDKVMALLDPKPGAPTPYDYTIQLVLTPAVEAKMKAANDNIVITSFYYGQAKPEFKAKADELNRIELGYNRVSYAGTARTIHMVSGKIDSSLFPQIVGGEPSVLMSIYGVSQGGDNNDVLECQSVNYPIKQLQTHTQVVTCDIVRA